MSAKDVKSEKCNLVVPGFRGHVKEVRRVAGSHVSGNSLLSSLSQFILLSAFTFRSLFSCKMFCPMWVFQCLHPNM